MTTNKSDPSQGCTVIRGPFSLFDDSFVVEFLEAQPDFEASILMRFTYRAGSKALNKLGKKHPLVPPYHLHWSQVETFLVLQGSVGVTTGYDQKDIILTPSNTPFSIGQYVPHTIWPDPDARDGEDAVALLWAHPNVENNIDHVFFEHLFRYLDECYKENKIPNIVQLLVGQHATDTSVVMAPGARFLGPLRWWFPWAVQAGISNVGKALGYRPDMKKYV